MHPPQLCLCLCRKFRCGWANFRPKQAGKLALLLDVPAAPPPPPPFPFVQYPWTGEAVEHPRRDKRRGKHTAHVERTPEGHPCIV